MNSHTVPWDHINVAIFIFNANVPLTFVVLLDSVYIKSVSPLFFLSNIPSISKAQIRNLFVKVSSVQCIENNNGVKDR